MQHVEVLCSALTLSLIMNTKWKYKNKKYSVLCSVSFSDLYPGSKASQDTTDESTSRITADSKRLTTFIRSAAQVKNIVNMSIFFVY